MANDVFINGTKVTGIKDQEIKNCNVKIDSEGDIHIEASDVKIVTQTEKPEKQYFISVSVDSPLPHELKISLNGKIVGKLDPGIKETLIELGTGVKKGENIISYLTEPVEKPIKFTILAGTGVKKGNNLEFSPLSTEKGEINNLGAAGTFKITAE
ncbi:MAG TPA: hypothetical protein ENN58_02585 [bacterium]|nr:hypothetical protein [bacterium]